MSTKTYLRRHPLDSEMVELIRTTRRRVQNIYSDDNRIRTTDSVFAVLHIDMFEGDILDCLTDEESEDEMVEIEMKLVGSPPKRQHDPDDRADWLYDQRKDQMAEERSK